MKDRFYMICTRDTVGTSASFHCKDGKGYSSDIRKAEVYTREEAQRFWNTLRSIDIPVSADHVDALAVRHVNCQYIPTESIFDSSVNYVGYKKGDWNGNDVYFLDGTLSTNDFDKAKIFEKESIETFSSYCNDIVWLPRWMVEQEARPTFAINLLNKRTMVQGAGLITPKHIKREQRRSKNLTGKSRHNCPSCGKIHWQYDPYCFESCSDIDCKEHLLIKRLYAPEYTSRSH